MRFSTAFVALSALLVTVVAQDLSGLPTCAQKCALGSIPKSCNSINVKCICTASSFINAITCCVATACSAADQEATIKYANQICGTVGITDLPQSATCSSNATAISTAGSSSLSSGATTTTNANTTAETSSSSVSSSTNSASLATTTDSVTASSSSSASSTTSATTTRGAAVLSMQNHNTGFVAILGVAVAYIGIIFAM